ncbi:MAG: hypothetical protein MUC81_12170, partial [Bacteroidia bacterium]|nr:hypothetical protein [Bacteroidia bacterium]
IAADESGSGVNAYLNIAYADDANGNGFTTVFSPAKNYIAIKHTSNPITLVQADFAGLWFNYKGQKGDPGNNGNNGADGADGADGKDGQSAFVYIGYADDENGDGFSEVFDPDKGYIAIRYTTWEMDGQDPGTFAGYWTKYKGDDGVAGQNGQSAYVYIAYADDSNGAGFTTVFNAAKNFIAIRSSTAPLTPVQADFAGRWFNYKGQQGNPGANGTNGSNGLNGQSAYVYIAYADSNTGTGFTTAFNAGKNYIAIKTSTVPLTPVQSDFNGLWFNYKGQAGVNGTNGSDGSNGLNGQNAFLYIAYADDVDGNGYSSTFDPNKNFIALFQATEPTDISQSTFDGLWVQYKGNSGGGDTGTVSIQRQDLTEDYTFTPVHNNFYLFNPGGSERKVYLDFPADSIRFTIKNIDAEGGGGALSIRDLDEAVIKSITLGKSAQILFDNSTNAWEVIEC